MQHALKPSFAEGLNQLWHSLHKNVEITILSDEVHYLRTMAAMVDDDVTSYLLLTKIGLAGRAENAGGRRLVAMNSFVEYRYDGGSKVFCQLVHPSNSVPSYGLEITSRVGAGLVGMTAGQSILWPNEQGTLCDLEVTRTESWPGINGWLGSSSVGGLN